MTLQVVKALNGEALQPRLTVEGLRELIADLRKQNRVPQAILVSEYDRRDLNQDLMAGAVIPVAKEDQKPEHDGAAIGVIEGVMIAAHPDIARGKARLLYPQPAARPLQS